MNDPDIDYARNTERTVRHFEFELFVYGIRSLCGSGRNDAPACSSWRA